MRSLGFLSFGHWQDSPHSATRTAGEALLQSVELAVAAEELGLDGACFRVHHFARQLAAPFPLLAAVGARTSRIEIGTGVIDMRYENPLYMAEEAASADLIAGGRLQLGVSRGSPEPAYQGARAFGHVPPEGHTDADLAGAGVVDADPGHAERGAAGVRLAIQPQSPGLAQRIWWGAGTRATAQWAGEQGMHLMSSTLLSEDTGVPFSELQAEQIEIFRSAWAQAGWDHAARVSVSRSVLPIVSDEDRRYFGARGGSAAGDQLGYLDGGIARFGRNYSGEPDVIASELAQDAAVRAADTLLLTVPNQLGVEYNARMLETIAREIAPALGWSPAGDRVPELAGR
jgi:alkanesulfonate monooxygenase SsuD/methylene tetrahydromethanopterin reductase-like flavin-dependent oxidoreductase (luciferase family)